MPGIAIEPPLETPLETGLKRQKSDYTFQRNSLPTKVQSNASGIVWYRADYELRYLKVARLCRVKIEQAFRAACKSNDLPAMLSCSKELREWCERERALLRIARPAAQTIKEKRGVSAPVVEAVTITEQQPVQVDAT